MAFVPLSLPHADLSSIEVSSVFSDSSRVSTDEALVLNTYSWINCTSLFPVLPYIVCPSKFGA